MTRPTEIDVGALRQREFEVLPAIVNRWSPRAMSGESLSDAELGSLLEAARWAPSCFNAQPWRLLYARRDGEHWQRFFDLLAEANQAWVVNAGVLIAFLSRRRFEHNDRPADTHSFDTGAAWQNVALQGSSMGLVVHGMRGFDKDRARETLAVPDLYEIDSMAAIGRPGEIESLPPSAAEKEAPSTRKPIAEFAAEGPFGF